MYSIALQQYYLCTIDSYMSYTLGKSWYGSCRHTVRWADLHKQWPAAHASRTFYFVYLCACVYIFRACTLRLRAYVNVCMIIVAIGPVSVRVYVHASTYTREGVAFVRVFPFSRMHI